MPPKASDQLEIPTAKVTVRLVIKKNEDGPSEITVTTDKSVKPTNSAKGWFSVPKEFPASTLEFQYIFRPHTETDQLMKTAELQ